MNNSELLAYSGEQLRYEVSMLFRIGKLLLSKERLSPTDIGLSVDNALIESFVIHFRSLYDFLYSMRKNKDDVLAEDFFERPEDWQNLRPELSEEIIKCKTRAAKEVVHITEIRFYGTPTAKPWPIPQMIDELKSAVKLFTTNASHEKLNANVGDFVQGVDSLLASQRRFRFQIDAEAER